MDWKPTIGAWPDAYGASFAVWAPLAKIVEVVLEDGRGGAHALVRSSDGVFAARVAGVAPGDRYRFRLDGGPLYPDLASRYQHEGVHGPSEVVDPNAFAWSDGNWHGIALEELVLYELHVGTFTSEGNFAGVQKRVDYLRDLGVTAIELMPVADFPGRCNWGYDGVNLFAPARCYGKPDDLRRLVDAAHRAGLAVILDVVYNHLGPDGNYLGVYSPYYFSTTHNTAWGPAINFDGEHCDQVRRFFIENAMHWVHEYHVDGFRFDATHAIFDDSPRHILAEISTAVRAAVPNRRVLCIAEDHRNLAHMLKPEREGGWGLDAVWSDGFHHHVRRALAGDHEGYYRDYTGKSEDLATTIRKGWFYCGQFSQHRGGPLGTDPVGLTPSRFVYCIQNHDQVGNRALGERLAHQIDAASYRAATVLLLCCPQTPLLFMGQEWAASSPFLYFTDHHEELGRLVTQGRREEFRDFAAFSDPEMRERIPDPQATATFTASKLDWGERDEPAHASILRLYQALLRLRRTEPARRGGEFAVTALGENSILLTQWTPSGPALLLVVQLKGGGFVDLRGHPFLIEHGKNDWEQVLDTEEAQFAADPQPAHVDFSSGGIAIRFSRPHAILFRERQ
ncbi:MAG: malto-oligosyltrehalose trehalohydrolase [Gemmataceae bacterium]|nr:malto-oligosyltrehalose trehalohydrolase [Gemmataceae bacterium]